MSKQQQAIATIGDISTQWIIQKRENYGMERQSRLEQIHVKNVGMVSVLKANNCSLEDGEPSLYAISFINTVIVFIIGMVAVAVVLVKVLPRLMVLVVKVKALVEAKAKPLLLLLVVPPPLLVGDWF